MQEKILNIENPMDYNTMMRTLEKLKERYSFIEILSIGTSILGRELPLIRLGNGEKKVLYIGTHHSLEWITSMLLLKFVEEYCILYKSNARRFRHCIKSQSEKSSIFIVPMLNPDGVELVQHGIGKENPLEERLKRMSGGDFSKWQANARGVDLNHNYNAGWHDAKAMEQEYGILGPGSTRYCGEYPESEPEVQAVCSLCRAIDFNQAIAFHSQGQEIYWEYCGVEPSGARAIGELYSRISGYTLSSPTGIASHGGFKDWFISEFKKPAYTIEVGLGQNPLPLTDLDAIYKKIEEILFISPDF
ncbi:MAG: M14 family metallocarboxypeptidase [Bacillota bacterium]|nr:M14 family metallocarboxypeptidase [Bacillota bacterium]